MSVMVVVMFVDLAGWWLLVMFVCLSDVCVVASDVGVMVVVAMLL